MIFHEWGLEFILRCWSGLDLYREQSGRDEAEEMVAMKLREMVAVNEVEGNGGGEAEEMVAIKAREWWR